MNNLLALPNEIWKWIPGYEGIYDVSSLGKVRRRFYKYRTVRTPYKYIYKYTRKDGYLCRYNQIRIKMERIRYGIPRIQNGRACKTNKEGKIYIQHELLGKHYTEHRLVARLFLGLDISNSKVLVCHKDDNPENNNYTNLFLGTALDNQMDCSMKNRKGKITDNQIIDIRRYVSQGLSDRKIGRIMGCSGIAIYKIRHNAKRGTYR